MRTRRDIEADVLAAAKELARRQGSSAGQMVSRLLRAALSGQTTAEVSCSPPPAEVVAGFRPFPSRADRLVSNDQIDQLRDESGL